jgi:hypothetical protein
MKPDPHITTTTGVRTPLSVEAIISTMRRHVPLYKSDPEFTDYFIKLALYLLEVNETPNEPAAEKAERKATVARLIPSQRTPTTEVCRVCGSPTLGKRVCPHCHHMVG